MTRGPGHSDDFRRACVTSVTLPLWAHRSHARRWSSDHPHGNGQRARIVETAQMRPGYLEGKPMGKPIPCALGALDRRRRAGATGAVARRYGPEVASDRRSPGCGWERGFKCGCGRFLYTCTLLPLALRKPQRRTACGCDWHWALFSKRNRLLSPLYNCPWVGRTAARRPHPGKRVSNGHHQQHIQYPQPI
jgi:hypothetical protein